MSVVLMFPSLGCISKPISPSQLAPPASLSRHVRRPSRCQAMHRLCSFSLGESRAVSLTQLNVPSHKHKLKPTPVAIRRLAVPCNVADLALSSFMYSLGVSLSLDGCGSDQDTSALALWSEGKHSGCVFTGEGEGDLRRWELNVSLFFPSN